MVNYLSESILFFLYVNITGNKLYLIIDNKYVKGRVET